VAESDEGDVFPYFFLGHALYTTKTRKHVTCVTTLETAGDRSPNSG